MTNPGTIVNPGTIEIAPLYKIYGSGGSSGELVINDTTIEVINLSGTITLDAELKNAYEGDILTYASNRNDNIRGIIPPLNVGSNTVSYSGGITKLEINGRWRYV